MTDDRTGKTAEIEAEKKEPEEERDPTWAGVCHLAGTLGLIWWIPTIDVWIPIGHLIAPLAVWIYKRGDSGLVDAAGREAINFQIWMTFYGFVWAFATLVVLGHNLLLVLAAVDAWFAVKATIETCNKDRTYRYPLVPFRLLGRGPEG